METRPVDRVDRKSGKDQLEEKANQREARGVGETRRGVKGDRGRPGETGQTSGERSGETRKRERPGR